MRHEVPLNEGNEVTRDGPWEVGAANITDEASERKPGGAGGGKVRPGRGIEGKKDG